MRNLFVKVLLNIYLVYLSLFHKKTKINKSDKKKVIVLTGTFHSMNWIQSHVIPIAKSSYRRKIYLITTLQMSDMDGIKIIRPPKLLMKIVGNVPARLLSFLYWSLKIRPNYVGGFHLLFNGIAAQAVSKLIKAKSIYFCVGGPAELQGGGINSENRFLGKLKEPDKKIESKLISVVRNFDLIITMGTSAKEFFQRNGVREQIEVISGGIDSKKYSGEKKQEKIYDFIFVGRLAKIKRIDIALEAIAIIKKDIKDVKFAIIGDGDKLQELKQLTEKLNITENVEFLGKM